MAQRVYAEVYGCTQNQGEVRALLEYMVERGWEWTREFESADALVVGMCIVVETTVRKILRRLRGLSAGSGERVLIITGCHTPEYREMILREFKGSFKSILFTTPRTYRKDLGAIVDDDGANNIVWDGGHAEPLIPSDIQIGRPQERVFDPVYYVVPIAQGCLGRCAYCITKLARGNLKSYNEERIINTIRSALKQGYREIRLSAQDTAVYGMDLNNGFTLPHLIKSAAAIPGDFMIRIGMMNPTYAHRIRKDLMEAYASPKVYKFLHIPVQHGSDAILKQMQRGHSVREFIETVNHFRAHYPEGVVSTDIIVGYPGESEEDFHRSVALVKDIKPDILNVTRFSPRPGTKAFDQKGDCPYGWETKARSRALSKTHLGIIKDRNRRFIGRETRVLVVEKGRGGKGYVGRDINYRPVYMGSSDLELGKFVNVRIVDTGTVHLIGRVI